MPNLTAKEMHLKVFSEEYDFMYDSIVDAKERSNGINPMSEEYKQRIILKRKKFGVLALAPNGLCFDSSSMDLCKEEFEARDSKKRTKLSYLFDEYLVD